MTEIKRPNIVLGVEGSTLVNSTTTSTKAFKLVDSGSNFTTLGIASGDIIKNTTDDTYAIILAVDDANTLSISPDIMVSSEGYTITDMGDAVIIYTAKATENLTKGLIVQTPPQSTKNKASGPKDTWIVDLQRVEERYTIRGFIDSGDRSKVNTLFKAGGVFNLFLEDEIFSINSDKMEIADMDADSENDERAINFTAIVGVNLGG